RGGDLGWVTQGRMVDEFDSAAFAMSEGDISTPVKSVFGYHLIKNDGSQDQDTPQGDQVKQAKLSHILIRNEASPATLARGLELMDTVLARTLDSDMETAARDLELELVQTEPLLEVVRVAELGDASSHHIMEWAFGAEIGDVSAVMENDDCYSVIRVDETLPAGPAKFEDVPARIKRDWRYDEAKKMCQDTVAVVYADVEAGLSLENAAYKHGLEYDMPNKFSRGSRVPDLVNDDAAVGVAFSLKEAGDMVGPLDYKGGTVIMQLVSRDEPDQTQYNDQRDSIYDAVLTAKQQKTWELWFRALHDNSEIENNVITQRARRMY
ncbi:MAG: hypothetical protein GY867_10140, partial [bacterium]|nr:hypothetical protein [bacterium]